MASGYKIAGGTDLDSVFETYTSGTKPSNTGYTVASVDLKDRYAPISTGSAAAATGFKIAGGADLNTLFAAIGSVSTVQLNDQNISHSNPGGANARATYRLNTSGAAEERLGASGTYNTLETWLLSGASSDYEARATLLSGSITSGTLNTWQSLGTSREWYANAPVSSSSETASLFIEIRLASSGVVQADATITLTASTL